MKKCQHLWEEAILFNKLPRQVQDCAFENKLYFKVKCWLLIELN